MKNNYHSQPKLNIAAVTGAEKENTPQICAKPSFYQLQQHHPYSQQKYVSKNLDAKRETKCSRSEPTNLESQLDASEEQTADTLYCKFNSICAVYHSKGKCSKDYLDCQVFRFYRKWGR